MLRPSRPMIRPFMSSARSCTTETVVSRRMRGGQAAHAHRQDVARAALGLELGLLLHLAHASGRLVARLASTSRSSTWRACEALSEATRSRASRCSRLAIGQLGVLALQLGLAVGADLLASRQVGQLDVERLLLGQRALLDPGDLGPALQQLGLQLVHRAPRHRCARGPRPARECRAAATISPSARERGCDHDCHRLFPLRGPGAARARASVVLGLRRRTEPCEWHGAGTAGPAEAGALAAAQLWDRVDVDGPRWPSMVGRVAVKTAGSELVNGRFCWGFGPFAGPVVRWLDRSGAGRRAQTASAVVLGAVGAQRFVSQLEVKPPAHQQLQRPLAPAVGFRRGGQAMVQHDQGAAQLVVRVIVGGS